jgi:hypothetical protein
MLGDAHDGVQSAIGVRKHFERRRGGGAITLHALPQNQEDSDCSSQTRGSRLIVTN